MKVKSSDLTGHALDWAVAKCEGHEWRCPWMLEKDGYISWQSYERGWGNPTPEYSTDWSQGGPIIEREKIDIESFPMDWEAFSRRHEVRVSGPTPLIAATRCYVKSKFGDVVDIPDELF